MHRAIPVGASRAPTTSQWQAITVACLIFAVHAAPVAAQEPVAVEQEPRHRVAYADARVRVLEIRVAPGEETLMHTHSHDSVNIVVRGARMSETTPRGWWSSTHDASPPGMAYYAALGGRPYAHRLKNIDSVATHVIAVELLGDVPASPAPTATIAYAERVTDNARVEAGRIRIAPGALFALPVLPGRLLLVGLTSGEVSVAADVLSVAPGSLHWLQAGPARTLLSSNNAPAELIAIQFR